MSQTIRIPRTAEPTARMLRRWCVANSIEYEFLPITGGGHPQIRIEVGRQSRKMAFSSTPSDNRRGSKNALAQLKRLAREIGWNPKQQKELDMRLVSTKTSKFDARPPTTGAASPVVVTYPQGVKVEGVHKFIPLCPEGYFVTTGREHNPWKQAQHERDDALYEAHAAGASAEALYNAVKKAGWDIAPSTVSTCVNRAKARRNADKKPAPTVEKPKAEAPKAHQASDLASELVAAILPIIERHARVDPEILAKAEKWDAIKGLIAED